MVIRKTLNILRCLKIFRFKGRVHLSLDKLTKHQWFEIIFFTFRLSTWVHVSHPFLLLARLTGRRVAHVQPPLCGASFSCSWHAADYISQRAWGLEESLWGRCGFLWRMWSLRRERVMSDGRTYTPHSVVSREHFHTFLWRCVQGLKVRLKVWVF